METKYCDECFYQLKSLTDYSDSLLDEECNTCIYGILPITNMY